VPCSVALRMALHFFEYAGLFADLVTSYILVPCSVALRMALHFFEYAGLFADLVTSYILVPSSVAYIVGRDGVDGRATSWRRWAMGRHELHLGASLLRVRGPLRGPRHELHLGAVLGGVHRGPR